MIRFGQTTGEDISQVLATWYNLLCGFDELTGELVVPDVDTVKAEALAGLEQWRGYERQKAGLSQAWGAELVYSGKFTQAQLWQHGLISEFYFTLEAAARGLTNAQMADLIIGQGHAWLAASDQIEAGYVAAKAAVETAASVEEMLAGLAALLGGN